MIEQGDVDTATIGAVGDQIFVAETGQPRATTQKVHHTVVFHFAERDEIDGLQPTGGKNGFGKRGLLVKVARRVPTSFGIGEKFPVVETHIVEGVIEIFHIPFQRAEACRLCFRGVKQPFVPLSPKGEEPCGKKRKKAKVDEVSTRDGEKEEEMARGGQGFHGRRSYVCVLTEGYSW